MTDAPTDDFSPAERAALAPYVTNLNAPVFALRHLPEEVVAVLFAYYSRSPHSLRRNLLRLLQEGDLDLADSDAPAHAPDEGRLAQAREKARAFHEKWVVGYGHASVAEHGCVHLALENVSILASKLVEDARLASYTEKSTRYVAFDPGKVYHPPAIRERPALAAAYRETVTALLDAYCGWADDFVRQLRAITPRGDKQTERGYENALRATAFDSLRYLLPTATHTNIGVTVNARSLETLLTKLLSQPLPEGRELGQRMKTEAEHIVPTLLKYADYNPYRADTDTAIGVLARERGREAPAGEEGPPPPAPAGGGGPHPPAPAGGGGPHPPAPVGEEGPHPPAPSPAHAGEGEQERPAGAGEGEQKDNPTLACEAGEGRPPRAGGVRASSVTLISADPDADDTLAASILYAHAGLPMAELLARVRHMTPDDKARVADEYLSRRGKHDAPGRALERLHITVEMTMDYGAFRDVQRHRIATQTIQPLTPALGYETPPLVTRFGYAEPFHALMAQAADTYQQITDAGLDTEAAYILPLATRVRALFTWNLRAAAHFIELRSARQGHPSYRKVAQDLYSVVAEAYPLAARFLRPNLNDYALTRE